MHNHGHWAGVVVASAAHYAAVHISWISYRMKLPMSAYGGGIDYPHLYASLQWCVFGCERLP